MTRPRYYIEGPCEKCGESHPDRWVWDADTQSKCRGSGGSRRELTIDYETAQKIIDNGWRSAVVIVDAALGDSE